MPVGLGAQLRIDGEEIGADFVELMNGGFQQMSAEAFVVYVEGWPVDTGISRGGLDYRLENDGRRARMIFTNLHDYAIWVERRWYRVRDVLGGRVAQIVAAVNRSDTTRTVSLSRRGGGFARRKFTVRGFDD